jgi:glycine/D-amino acid oxidase-like deaminating enzyme
MVSEPSRPPIAQSCYWLAQRASREPEPLTGELAADVAIVGAGFTGLWTALFLKRLEPGLTVVVLDGELAGYGASGRNAGIAGETIDHSHELAIAHFGLDEARELARLGRANLDEMEASGSATCACSPPRRRRRSWRARSTAEPSSRRATRW